MKKESVMFSEKLFDELLESIKQGGKILRGEMKLSRAFKYDKTVVQLKQEDKGLSQRKFKNFRK